jgi:excisionase family DNA binding protein
MEPLLSVHDVAAQLGIHHKKVQRLARTGVIPCIKVGAVYRFQPAALEAWVASQHVIRIERL